MNLNFQIKKATPSDLEFLFSLRNEESVRKSSFGSEPIALEDHKNWFKKVLTDPHRQIYIIEVSGQPMAQVRFDGIKEKEAEVNIAVTEKFQGKGYGSAILRETAKQFFVDFPQMNLIHAYIKLDNAASLRSFNNAGYQLVGETTIKNLKCAEMNYNKTKVLLLSSDNPEGEKLWQYLLSWGEEVIFTTEKITSEKVRAINPDIMISYNSRYILKEDVFTLPRLGTINLHVAYLPWNRGADPNFWSQVEGTPKGVTIHFIDAGVDTGDIIGQESVEFSDEDTLGSSYLKLHTAIQELFKKLWPKIRSGQSPRHKQQGEGTFHLSKDKERFNNLIAKKSYDTLIKDLAALNLDHKTIH